MRKLIVIALVSALGLSACGSSGGTVTNMNSTEFSKKITEDSVVVLDVRRTDEFVAGHLAGALHIDVEAANFQRPVSRRRGENGLPVGERPELMYGIIR